MSQTPPWSEHRVLAELVAQSIADALTSASGSIVGLGKAAPFEPETMLVGRPLPLRAIVVSFRRPLRDVMIFITSHKGEVIMPLVEAATRAAITALDVPVGNDQHGQTGHFDVHETVEYETAEQAIDQCDALYLEATYPLELPTGELRIVLGTGLLESAACFTNSVPDPFAEEPALVRGGTELELGDAIDTVDAPRYELGDQAIGDATDAPTLQTDAITEASEASEIDAYDSMLAAQEQAEAEAAAAISAANTAATTTDAVPTAASSISAAQLDATQRWTQLLSGVEVELSAELGRADLPLGEITRLDQDCVLTLEQLVHEPVTVYVNGTRFATARLVVVDGEYGIEIIEVVEQEQLVNTIAA